MDNKTIKKAVKLSREYPKTTQNVKLLQIYLSKNGDKRKP
jgi:hypothetical protein